MSNTTPTVTDEMMARAAFYLARGKNIIANSTYEGLQGATNTRNAKRMTLFIQRAERYDDKIQAAMDIEVTNRMAEHEQLETYAELVIDSQELVPTVRKMVRGNRYLLTQDEVKGIDKLLNRLGGIFQRESLEELTNWNEEVGAFMLSLQAKNDQHMARVRECERLRSRLSQTKLYIADDKQVAFTGFLNSLKLIIKHNDVDKLESWYNKAKNHERDMINRSRQIIPNNVGYKRRAMLEEVAQKVQGWYPWITSRRLQRV